MHLAQLIPDPDLVLALPPEELAEHLLVAAKANVQSGGFTTESVLAQTIGYGIAAEKQPVYSPARMPEIELAVEEAWQWLRVNLLIVPAPGPNGRNGWMHLSRRGEQLVGRAAAMQSFREAIAFPKALLHASIADKVWLGLARGELDEAVFAAFKAVEVAVRDAAGLAPTDIGTSLMRKAFDKTSGPLTNIEDPESEREALAHLFAGAIGSYKNSHSHRTVSLSELRDAQEMVLLATHLLRIVDARRVAK